MPRLRDLLNIFRKPSGSGGNISTKQLEQLLFVQAIFAFAHSFAWVLFVPWLFISGFTELDYIIYFMLLWAFTIPMLLVKRKVKASRAMALGNVGRSLAFFAAIHFFHKIQLVLIALFIAWIIVEFWVVFNTVYERKAPKKDRAFLNSIMMVVYPLSATVLPVVGGLVAESYGFGLVFLIGGIIMLIAAYAASRIKGLGYVELDPTKAFKDLRKMEPFVFLQGFWEGIEYAAIPIITLSLVTSVFDYAWFFGYLGFIGAFAALIFGRLSDKLHGRLKFAAALTVIMGLACIGAGLSWDYMSWALFIGVMSFCGHIVKPFLWTIVTDVSKRKVHEGMLVREYFLNIGRTLGVVMLLGFYLFLTIKAALFIAGFLMMLYPVVMLYEKQHKLSGLS